MPDNKEAQDLFRQAQAEAKQAADALANDKRRKAGFDAAVSAGQKAFQTKNYDAAIKAYQDANKLIPNDPVLQQLMKQAQDGQALAAKTGADFQKAIDAGQTAMLGMKYADAVKAFTSATLLDPNDVRARKMLQQAQQALANANQAALNMANYQKAMTVGQTAMTAKNYLNAVTAFKDALKWMPGDQKAQTQLQLAQQALTDSMKTKPMPPDPMKMFSDAMQKATAADKAQKFSDAVSAFKEALSVRPKDAEALAGLKQSQFSLNMQQGQVYLNNAMWMLAQEQFESALAAFPNNDQAKKLLQKAKSKMK